MFSTYLDNILKKNDVFFSKIIFVSLIGSVAISSFASLQLYGDGSGYLLKMIVHESPMVWQARISNYIFQYPALLAIKINNNFWFLRYVFCITYALIPFLSFLMSYYVIKNTHKYLVVWPILILYINLVNWSWVSEILIAIQIGFPLVLSTALSSGRWPYWAVMPVGILFLLFLHPMSSIIILFVGVLLMLMLKGKTIRWIGISALALISCLAVVKFIYFSRSFTPWESRFLELNKILQYLFSTSAENILHFIISTFILYSIVYFKNVKFINNKIMTTCVALNVICMIFVIRNSNLIGLFTIKKFMVISLLISGWLFSLKYILSKLKASQGENEASISVTALVVGPSVIALISQYGSHGYELKTGATLFMALAVFVVSVMDIVKNGSNTRLFGLRLRMAAVLSCGVLAVIAFKSVSWAVATKQLQASLRSQDVVCREIDAGQYSWLHEYPYIALRKFKLPYLAIVIQDEAPRKLLLQAGRCRMFTEQGIVYLEGKGGEVFPGKRIEKLMISRE